MGLNDRMFEPPAADLAKINARLGKLPASLRALIERAGDALAIGDLRGAQHSLAEALAAAPDQPDVLRLYGLLCAGAGNLAGAVANFEAALRAAPDDAMGYWQYARVCEEAGKMTEAWRLRNQAVQRLPDSPMALADLGEHLSRHGRPEEALSCLDRAVRLAPDYAPAQLKLGDTLVSCGRAEEGAAAIRNAIAIEPAFGAAWLSLADVKTVPVTDDEVARMRELLGGRDLDDGERTAVAFSLAWAYEIRGDCAEAFELLLTANARRKCELAPWNLEGFLSQMRNSADVFAGSPAQAKAPQLGAEMVFIVGIPRSGTTLVEQVLASHREVRALGERGELAQVLAEESMRRQQRYPGWVPDANAQDWHRLGQRYLELTARFRDGHALYTDKMPNNWQALGAIRAMLPAARIVVCRRDPLENCWSCFKQYFPRGWEFTYDIDQLAAFWKEFDRAASSWADRDPGHVREQGYEALTENPEPEIRALLNFCGLAFDAACLVPHQAQRTVNTLSAAQVREPIHSRPKVAAAYGALLNPLRKALERASEQH